MQKRKPLQKNNYYSSQGYGYEQYTIDALKENYDCYEGKKQKKKSQKQKKQKEENEIQKAFKRFCTKENKNEWKELIYSDKENFTSDVQKMIDSQRTLSAKITDRLINVLIIAEKPFIAKVITRALSKNYEIITFDTANGLRYYQFHGKFRNVPANIYVCSVFGHLHSLDFQVECHLKMELPKLYDSPTLVFLKDEIVPLSLSFLAQGIDIICLWLDCDKEGENICYQTVFYTFPFMNIKRYKQLYRAKFSSLTKSSLISAYTQLENLPDMLSSQSVDARRLIDLKVGCTFTSFLSSDLLSSLRKNKNFAKYGNIILSYGPCQTPALALCVERDNEIALFERKRYYILCAKMSYQNRKIQVFGKIKHDRPIPGTRLEELKMSNEEPKVTEVTEKNKEKAPQKYGLNTVKLLSLASQYLKFSPLKTMQLAESLYSKGYISYPRTESTKYPDDFDPDETFANLKNYEKFKDIADKIKKNIEVAPTLGIDKGDHPPITPTGIPQKNVIIPKDEKTLFDFISCYFLSNFCAAAKYVERTTQITLMGEIFEAESKDIQTEGYWKIVHWEKSQTINSSFPNLQVDETVKFLKIECLEMYVSPPEKMTEWELVEKMEENGIGTDGSIPLHINTLVKRKYIKVDQETRTIQPTAVGRALIDGLRTIDPELVNTKLRKEMEENVNEIAKNKKTYDEVVSTALAVYKGKFEKVMTNEKDLTEIFTRMIDES